MKVWEGWENTDRHEAEERFERRGGASQKKLIFQGREASNGATTAGSVANDPENSEGRYQGRGMATKKAF